MDRLSGVSVEELSSAWLAHLEVEGKSRNTLSAYKGIARDYLAFLAKHGIRYDSPSHQDLDRWILWLRKGRKLNERSTNQHISSVRNFYRWLKRSGYVFETAVQELRMVRAPRLLPKPLSESDITSMIEAAASTQERALMEVLYGTGCRVGALCGMNVGDVSFESRAIRVFTKNGREELLPIGECALEALKVHLAGEPPAERPLWIGKKRGRWDNDTVRRHLREVAVRAGVKGRIYPHRFRHSFATHMLDHGAQIEQIQQLMGHQHISTTMIYTQVSRERVRKAYEVTHPRARAPGASGDKPGTPTSSNPDGKSDGQT